MDAKLKVLHGFGFKANHLNLKPLFKTKVPTLNYLTPYWSPHSVPNHIRAQAKISFTSSFTQHFPKINSLINSKPLGVVTPIVTMHWFITSNCVSRPNTSDEPETVSRLPSP